MKKFYCALALALVLATPAFAKKAAIVAPDTTAPATTTPTATVTTAPAATAPAAATTPAATAPTVAKNKQGANAISKARRDAREARKQKQQDRKNKKKDKALPAIASPAGKKDEAGRHKHENDIHKKMMDRRALHIKKFQGAGVRNKVR